MICPDCGNDHEHQRQDFPAGATVEAICDFCSGDVVFSPGDLGQVIDHADDGRAIIRFDREGSVQSFHKINIFVRRLIRQADGLSFGDTGPVVMPPAETTKRQTLISPAEIKNRLTSWGYVAQTISYGLDGIPFHWSDGERRAYTEKARAMGITLVTETWLKKNGYRLRRGAKPIGTAYFASPISNDGRLYVLECQAVKEEEEQP